MPRALRTIAEQELDQCFPNLDARMRGELATSLVCQWIGNDGHAVLLARQLNFWFRITDLEDG